MKYHELPRSHFLDQTITSIPFGGQHNHNISIQLHSEMNRKKEYRKWDNEGTIAEQIYKTDISGKSFQDATDNFMSVCLGLNNFDL